MSNPDELAGVIYTKLEDVSEPCSLDDICADIRGMRNKKDEVRAILENMCACGMVTMVREKFILAEKLKASARQDAPVLQHNEQSRRRVPEADHGHERVQTQGASRSDARNNGFLETQGAVALRSSSNVPVQRSTSQSIQSATAMKCDQQEFQNCTVILQNITDFLRRNAEAVKAKDIAQGAGLGKNKKSVNRYLYLLEKHKIVEKISGSDWKMVKDVTQDDLKACGAQLSKSTSISSFEDVATDCPCPNAGPNCHHTHNNTYINQEVHHHHNTLIVGDNNTVKPPSTGNRQVRNP